MTPLMECVPNFSEGRDATFVQALVDALNGIPGVLVLDSHSDADHNRSVVTLAGEPEAVLDAALLSVGTAAATIDLRRHSGAHPRIGAADVLPFVPLEGASLEDCIPLAHRAGAEIWRRYHIPVYFYGAAASRPERAELETIRRGQFEGLSQLVRTDPTRAPDIGGPLLHPSAGAVAVGARKILIAYNLNLNTGNAAIAREIAATVRASGGGLPCVKAIGIDLQSRGVAQVSMNVTDYERTPLRLVFERVRDLAARHGCAIAGAEIVGLVPRRAIEGLPPDALPAGKVPILEERLSAALATKRPGGILKGV